MDKNFPLHIWCRLLDQAELTLNMLRTSRLNPNLSAHEQLHGIHDFNATPLAHQVPSALPMKNPANVVHGPLMGNMDGTWGQHRSTIDVIKYTSPKHRAHEFVIQWSFFQPTVKCPSCQPMMQSYTKQTTSSKP